MFEVDLADKVDDLICTFEGNPDNEADVLAILIIAAVFFIFCFIALVKNLYKKYRKLKYPDLDNLENLNVNKSKAFKDPENLKRKVPPPPTLKAILPASPTPPPSPIPLQKKPEKKAEFIKVPVVKTKSSEVPVLMKCELIIANGEAIKIIEQQEEAEIPPVIVKEEKKQTLTQKKAEVLGVGIEKKPDGNDDNKIAMLEEKDNKLKAKLMELCDCVNSEPNLINFINLGYSWLYTSLNSQKKEWFEEKRKFINSLNNCLEDNNWRIEIQDLHFDENISFRNLFGEFNQNNNIKLTCDSQIKLNGSIRITTMDKVEEMCKFFVETFSGRLSTIFEYEKRMMIVRFDGWPQIMVSLSDDLDRTKHLSEKIASKLTSAVRNAIAYINLKKFRDFPKQPINPISIGGGGGGNRMSNGNVNGTEGNRYIMVTIIGGEEIGVNKGVEEPYVVCCLDEPPQKFQTAVQKFHNPLWNENFIFQLGEGGEILFEVYDQIGTRFLGCNILSVDEIENQKIKVPLKSRRMEISDQITGKLSVEFLFFDENEFIRKSQEISRGSRHNLIEKSLPNLNNSEIFLDKTIQNDLYPNNKGFFTESLNKSKTFKEYCPRRENELMALPPIAVDRRGTIGTSPQGMETQYGEERGRRLVRKGNIFTAIRRRFSKNNGRSLSAQRNQLQIENNDDTHFVRSISADRTIEKNYSGGQGQGQGSTFDITASASSSTSNISGLSSSTYIHEDSALVIEYTDYESQDNKYFVVPPMLSSFPEWIKQGKKLHVYNNHTFVAKRIQVTNINFNSCKSCKFFSINSGMYCEVCFDRFSFSLKKQAYQCRDCKFLSHKPCHVKSPPCRNSKAISLNINI